MHKFENVKKVAQKLYQELLKDLKCGKFCLTTENHNA